MITKQEMESVANTAIIEYYVEMFVLMSENIPRERLAIAHNRARSKVLKKLRSTGTEGWDTHY